MHNRGEFIPKKTLELLIKNDFFVFIPSFITVYKIGKCIRIGFHLIFLSQCLF